MKQSLNHDTLAYQLGMRPALQFRDMRSLPLQPIVANITALLAQKDIYSVVSDDYADSEKVCGNPERDAVVFYMLNHAVSLVRQRCHVYEPLGAYMPLMEAYHVELAARASRMFSYLLLICTRESRHDKASSTSSEYKALISKYGSKITDFHKGLKGLSSSGAADKVQASPPDATIGAYTSFLSDVFYKGTYSSGYGGKAWGAVADVLRDFVHGKLTAEMMMDTSFTLCHNNGPIFNKGMLFDTYSPEIYKILDVQRSGQIPQLVASGGVTVSKNSKVQSLWNTCVDLLGDTFSGHVDWFLVEELGALKSYSTEQAQQVAKYGHPSKFKAKLAAEAAKAEAKSAAQLAQLKSQIEIFPGQYISKVGRQK